MLTILVFFEFFDGIGGGATAAPFDSITRNLFDSIRHEIFQEIYDPFEERDQPA